jgi:hypothetical protein
MTTHPFINRARLEAARAGAMASCTAAHYRYNDAMLEDGAAFQKASREYGRRARQYQRFSDALKWRFGEAAR